MSEEQHINVAGVVLVDNSGRYLLVQEKQEIAYGLWNLPAGHVDPGETLKEAAVREAQEEVNLRVEILDDLPINVKEKPGITLNAFRAKIISGEMKKLEDELLDASWLTMEAIYKLSSGGKIRDQWVLDSINESKKLENYRD